MNEENQRIVNGIPMPSKKIAVVGVGGGGGNAVNNMVGCNFTGIDFIAMNTDRQHLLYSKADYRFQLGSKDNDGGYGAGADPNVGAKAALDNRPEIEEFLRSAILVIITAGFGKGTGTGATPVIARIAKDMGKLVVCVITTPFNFEGKRLAANAQLGIENLKRSADAYIVVDNQRLVTIADSSKSSFSTEYAYKYADDVLKQCILGISDIMLNTQLFNIDYNDLRTCLRNQGRTYLGIGYGSGERRVRDAVELAKRIELQDTTIKNARSVLLYVKAKKTVPMSDIDKTSSLICEETAADRQFIFGFSFDDDNAQSEDIIVLLIACGFDQDRPEPEAEQVKKIEEAAKPQTPLRNPTIVDIDDDSTPPWAREDK